MVAVGDRRDARAVHVAVGVAHLLALAAMRRRAHQLASSARPIKYGSGRN